jgi:hypothetical protein
MQESTPRPTIIIPEYDIKEVPVNVRAKQMIVLSVSDQDYLRKWREKQRKRFLYFLGTFQDSKPNHLDTVYPFCSISKSFTSSIFGFFLY